MEMKEELMYRAYEGTITLKEICSLVEKGKITESDGEWLASILLDC